MTKKTHQQINAMKSKIIPPQPFYIPLNRRRFMRAIALASAGFTLKGYLADALTVAPSLTQGPYYPLASNIPLDKDNDLIYLNDRLTRAIGGKSPILPGVCSRAAERRSAVRWWKSGTLTTAATISIQPARHEIRLLMLTSRALASF